jgi:hypothetical protein
VAQVSSQRLSLATLRRTLQTLRPLKINHQVNIGGTLLIEICKARNVNERVVLGCVREIVEKHDADVNLPAGSADPCSGITPLSLASARGMASVVAFLLKHGAKCDVVCAGRFRVAGKNYAGEHSPAGWAKAMYEQELLGGTPKSLLSGLRTIRALLSEESAEMAAAGQGRSRPGSDGVAVTPKADR